MFLQVVGGFLVFLIVFILLGIPLGYTKIEKTKEEERTSYNVKVGNVNGE